MIEPPLDPPDSYWDDEPEGVPMELDVDGLDSDDCRSAWEIERDAARCEDAREAQLELHYRRLEKHE